MHEVSLMKNLLSTVEEVAAKEDCRSISVIHLRIGEMAGVNIDALKFAFEVLSKGTITEGGRLEFEKLPLVIRCRHCGTENHPEDFVFRCPECNSPDVEIISGREMEVDYILSDGEEDEGYGEKSQGGLEDHDGRGVG